MPRIVDSSARWHPAVGTAKLATILIWRGSRSEAPQQGRHGIPQGRFLADYFSSAGPIRSYVALILLQLTLGRPSIFLVVAAAILFVGGLLVEVARVGLAERYPWFILLITQVTSTGKPIDRFRAPDC